MAPLRSINRERTNRCGCASVCEWSLSATGKPIRRAAARAAPRVDATTVAGVGSPNADRSVRASESFNTLRGREIQRLGFRLRGRYFEQPLLVAPVRCEK